MVRRELTRVLKDRYPTEHAAKAYIDQLSSIGQRGLTLARRAIGRLRTCVERRRPQPDDQRQRTRIAHNWWATWRLVNRMPISEVLT